VSQGFIKTTSNDYLANSDPGSVEFNEVGINFTVQPADRLRVGVQLFARDLGPVGNYTPRLDWFYLDYRFWDWLGFRAGRTKVPFGLYNETSDIDAARIPVLLPQSVYPTQNRDLLLAQTGGEIYGTVGLGTGGDLEYRVYGGTLFFDASESEGTVEDLSVPYLFGGRLMWQTPLDGVQLGASAQALRLEALFTPAPEVLAQLEAAGSVPPGFTGPIDLAIDAVLGVASIEYARDEVLLATEYSRWRTEVESTPVVGEQGATTSERLYAMGAYRITPWLVPGVYYSVLYPDVDDRKGRDAWQHDFAGTLRFDINANWLVKLEGHYMHGTAALNSPLNGNKPLGALDKDWGLLLLKTTAYF